MTRLQQLWARFGILLFWLTWPISWLHLRGSKRTRLLVVCGNYLIVTKRWLGDGRWSLPGGGLHREEDSRDGALRELYEETRLHINSSRLRRHSDRIFKSNGLSFNYVFFIAKVGKKYPLVHQSIELTESVWIHKSELSVSNASPDVLAALHTWWG